MALRTTRRYGPHGHAGTGGRRRVVRPVLRAMAVLALTTLLGVALSGATTAEPATPGTDHRAVSALSSTPPRTGSTAADDGPDRTFAYRLIYSGAGALVVSTVGLVMVARRRRRW